MVLDEWFPPDGHIDEELGAARVRLAGVGHGERPGRVRVLGEVALVRFACLLFCRGDLPPVRPR